MPEYILGARGYDYGTGEDSGAARGGSACACR